MTGLEHHFVSRKRKIQVHQTLGFAFKVIKLMQELDRVARLKVVMALFDFVLMEYVTVGQGTGRTVGILPARINQVKDVVAVLQVHRQTFETVGDFTGDGLTLQTAHLLEVRKLRHFHTVHPHFPTETPGAERRVFPVVFHKTDIVDFGINPQGTETAQIQVHDIGGGRLNHHLELVVLVQTVGVFAVTGVFRTTGGLHIGSAPRFRSQGSQESRGVRSPRAHFHINRLQKRAALLVPILL